MGPYDNAIRQANEAVEDSSPPNETNSVVEEPKSEQSSKAPS